jgi:hypothetical protein
MHFLSFFLLGFFYFNLNFQQPIVLVFFLILSFSIELFLELCFVLFFLFSL